VNITRESLLQLLCYDEFTGVFTWAQDRFANGRLVARRGDIAGSTDSHGYRQIRVGGRKVLANRLAWLYMTGEWPDHFVDHEDGSPANNRWKNLRKASRAQNAQNMKRARSDSSTGLLGAYPHGDKFCAQITVDGKQTSLGYFDTPEQAHAVYLTAKRQLHSHNTL
jgi:hypothetical protein